MSKIIKNPDWWRGAVMYQIYPRSYMDTTGNGIGDLPGITQKLDYIAGLGVNGIWISPFFRSPMKDFGYDVADYRDIDPLFGRLDDFKELLERAHDMDLKVIIDMVMSHTSDQHAWFQESRSDQVNSKADWYVWADPSPDGTPPTNWMSVFGGPAWSYDVRRGQYYLHSFLKEQPDLNYHNIEVQDAMLSECRFWLDMGVDGFRLDAVNHCVNDKELRNNPPRENPVPFSQLEFPETYAMQWHVYDKSRPENLNYMRRVRALLDEYPDRFAIAEIGDDHAVKQAAEYTASPDLIHSAYSFGFLSDKGALPGASFFRKGIQDQMNEPGDSWPSWAFSNHDVIRAASRWSGEDYGHDPHLSKLLVALLATLRGTAFLYQGDELGLPEVKIPYEQLVDPWGLHLYPLWQGRDGCRTPMPWYDEPGKGGFTSSDNPWLRVSNSHLPLSVARQEVDPESTLHFTRVFLNWRKDHRVLWIGDIDFPEEETLPDEILCAHRHHEDSDMIAVFNLSPKAQEVEIKALNGRTPLDFGDFRPEYKHDGTRLSLEPYAFAFFA